MPALAGSFFLPIRMRRGSSMLWRFGTRGMEWWQGIRWMERSRSLRRRMARNTGSVSKQSLLWGKDEAWFATGGKGAARVIQTNNGGRTWTAANVPVRHDAASAGIFSLAF